jgi:pimeloyl-ACP methyl ester carboxylesterase
MLRRILMGAAGVLLVSGFVIFARYTSWRDEQVQALQSGGTIIETSVGPIEYVMETGAGPVLLFVHGTPGGYDQAPDQDFGIRVLAPSRPGYLSTPLDSGRTPAEQAEAYVALLDALEIREVIVMGVSGGGPSAISFAAAYPERTRALIALEAVSHSESLREAPAFMNSDFLLWFFISGLKWTLGSEGIVELMVPNPANQELAIRNPRKMKKIESVFWSLWPPSLRQAGTQNDMVQFSDLSLPLDQISVPTLIIHGTSDINVPFGHAELLAEKIPGAELRAIPEADHMMPFTHEEEMLAAIADFISRLSVNL